MGLSAKSRKVSKAKRPSSSTSPGTASPDEPLPRAVSRQPRIAVWDIEASHLKANIGYMICASIRWVGDAPGKTQTFRIDETPQFKEDPTNDRGVVEGLCEALNTADMWFTWYGTRFDLPFLKTRLLDFGLAPPLPVPHVDGWRIARFQLDFHSNRLATVGEFVGAPEKTPIKWAAWRRAPSGHLPSIRDIVSHCEADVLSSEAAYHKLKPFCTTHPNLGIIVRGHTTCCPVCGSARLLPVGRVVKRVSEAIVYRCRRCGTPSQAAPHRIEGEGIR